MQKVETLQSGKVYHIYNRGINNGDLFFEAGNYEYFLKLYENHISPIANTYAWCLMKNHFHFLVQIKEDTPKAPHQGFSNLFNAYTKAVNKKYNRNSSLFQRQFKRKLVSDETYLKNLILYIHNNPVNHRICEHPIEYAWSSYLAHCLDKDTNLKKTEVINLFDDVENFKTSHQLNSEISELEF